MTFIVSPFMLCGATSLSEDYAEKVIELPIRHYSPLVSYSEHIVETIREEANKKELIIVPWNDTLHDTLMAEGIPFTAVVPSWKCKDEWIARLASLCSRYSRDEYKERMSLLENEWDGITAEYVSQLEDKGVFVRRLEEDDYLRTVYSCMLNSPCPVPVFRGKRTDQDEWVYGDYRNIMEYDNELKCNGYHPRIVNNSNGYNNDVSGCRVISETVGFSVDRVDICCRPIFTGDIITCTDLHGDRLGVVRFYSGKAYLSGKDGFSDEYLLNESNIKVIGNETDNPELIAGE